MVSSKLIFITVAMCIGIAISVAGYLECNPVKQLAMPVAENCIETPHGESILPLVESLMPVESELSSKPRGERSVRRNKSRSSSTTAAKANHRRGRVVEIKVEPSEPDVPAIGVIEIYL